MRSTTAIYSNLGTLLLISRINSCLVGDKNFAFPYSAKKKKKKSTPLLKSREVISSHCSQSKFISIAAISIHHCWSNRRMWSKNKIRQVICKSHPDITTTMETQLQPNGGNQKEKNLFISPFSSFRIRTMKYFLLEPMKNSQIPHCFKARSHFRYSARIFM